MIAPEYVAEFSKRIGRDAASVRVADRALADAGLRNKAIGKRLPDIQLTEGVLLLLALMSGQPKSRAAESALELSEFKVQDGENLASLAALLGVKKSELVQISLLDAIRRICACLPPKRDKNKTQVVEIEVEEGGFATVRIETETHDGKIMFSGRGSRANSPVFREIRIVSDQVLRWIGQNAKGDS